MCGASSSQNQISDEQNAFYKQLTQEYSTTFAQNQNILGALTKSFTPTLAAGPNQTGFSDAERTALNTQATEGTAADYAKGQTATAEALAARGGGNSMLPSGVDSSLLAGNANAAAGEEAGLKNQITQNDYATGRSNYYNAAAALGGVSGDLGTTGLANATTGAGSAASSTANQIASEDNSVWQGALGAVTSLAGAGATAYGGRRP